jgi:hypothetical protein
MTTYHIHHYLPKHAGGTDSTENLIKVTIEEHAAFHYERWVLVGDQYDKISWLCLSGQIQNKEANRLAMSLGGKSSRCHTKEASEKAKKTYMKKLGVSSPFNLPHVKEKRDKTIQALLLKHNVINVSQIPEVKAKIGSKNSLSQRGERNSQYGTIWITDGKTNKKIQSNIELPKGFSKGRTIRHQSLKKSSNAIALSSIHIS